MNCCSSIRESRLFEREESDTRVEVEVVVAVEEEEGEDNVR